MRLGFFWPITICVYLSCTPYCPSICVSPFVCELCWCHISSRQRWRCQIGRYPLRLSHGNGIPKRIDFLDKTNDTIVSLSADDDIGITSAEFTSHTGFKHGTSPRLVFGLCSSRLRSRGFVAEQLPVRQLRQPRQPRPDIKHKVGKSTSTCH
ncbi:hypothetical protein J3E68DRAFT_144680 [Trichoderma sp. SZMC 28012]